MTVGLSSGLSAKQVADKHGVSVKTVARVRRSTVTDDGFGSDEWILK
jgi:DNA-binding NarL/FixJ family response regulator